MHFTGNKMVNWDWNKILSLGNMRRNVFYILFLLINVCFGNMHLKVKHIIMKVVKYVTCPCIIKYVMQFFLRVSGSHAGARYRSGSTVLHDTRPLSSGTQTFDTKKIEWPLNQPLKKLEADIQVNHRNTFII